MNAADASRTGHPEYTAGACGFLLDGQPQARRGIIVQCPTVDHEHTTGLRMKVELTEDPEVGASWVVIAHAEGAIRAMEAAYSTALSLAELLHLPVFPQREG